MKTPETESNKINLGSPCGQFSEWYVTADCARKLELERDEARAALSGRTVSCSQCNQAAIQIEVLQAQINSLRTVLQTLHDLGSLELPDLRDCALQDAAAVLTATQPQLPSENEGPQTQR